MQSTDFFIPFLAAANLARVSSVATRPKLEPAIFNILYSGFNKLICFCSNLIHFSGEQYFKISSLKFS
jgi:hypothetical protein